MRIIGGFLKRKKLSSVPGVSTRPTSDRLRESIFNIISHEVQDARVLDLFAGTGALGIESLSRGAQHCVFIDSQHQPVSVIRKNINNCSLEDRSKIYKWDIIRNLNCIKNASPKFNLVFIDPPYSRNMVPRTLENLDKADALKDESLIVIEHASSDAFTPPSERFQITDCRVYGTTSVSFLLFKK